MIFLIISVSLVYILVGVVIGIAIEHIRQFDLTRNSIANKHSKTNMRFEHHWNDGIGFFIILASIFWPIVGIPMLLWHLHVVDWSKNQRRWIKEYKQFSSDELEESLQISIQSMRNAKIEELERQEQAARSKLKNLALEADPPRQYGTDWLKTKQEKNK